MYYSISILFKGVETVRLCTGVPDGISPSGSIKINGSDFSCYIEGGAGRLELSFYLSKYQIVQSAGYMNYQDKKGIPYMEFGNCKKMNK